MKHGRDLKDFLFTWGNVVRRARSLWELKNHLVLVEEISKCALTEEERAWLAKWVVMNIDFQRKMLAARGN